jgi:hypothetical protein
VRYRAAVMTRIPIPRRRSSPGRGLTARQEDDSTCLPSGVTYPPCNWVGNEVRTCYPLANSTIQQNTWTKVIWNVKQPYLAQLGFIDIYLRSADSGVVVANWTHVPIGRGEIQSCADDDWLGRAGPRVYTGQDISWNFQYILVQAGTEITGAEQAETPFTVLQTRPLNSVEAQSSAEAAASSASQASLSSVSASATNGNNNGNNNGNPNAPNGGLQGEGNKDNFPSWAIALLAVLGFFALLGALLCSFFACREYRRKQRRRSDSLRRESMGSEAPMMAAVGAPGAHTAPQSPTQGPLAAAGFSRGYRGHAADASSTTSHSHSGIGESAPFDAAFVADAFRNAMRRPDFKDRPLEEGESPDAVPDLPKPSSDVVLSRELAEEGRDIRSVRSVRGVKVESLLDHDRDDHS